MGPTLLARAGSFPSPLDGGAQILASGGAHRQRLWRPQSVLFLPIGGRIRVAVACVSRVGFGITRKHLSLRGGLILKKCPKKSARPRGRVRYPSGASSGAATTRAGTRRSELPFVSSAAASPCSWYSASLLTCQRS